MQEETKLINDWQHAALQIIEKTSPTIASAIFQELHDQRSHLKMIASENFCSYAVQLAMGNLLSDKYAEGYIEHRFYAGCNNVDTIEQEAVNQLKSLFQCEHAFVQPHSGADANLIALWAILTEHVQEPFLQKHQVKKLDELTDAQFEELRQAMLGQKLLGMSLIDGGHLTHGYRYNITAKLIRSYSYGVDPKTHRIDYDHVEKLVIEHQPLILLAGYSAYSRHIDFAKMQRIAHRHGAILWVDMAHFAGLVAGGVFQGVHNPVPYADMITSTTHKTLRGPRGGIVLCKKRYAPWTDKACPFVMGGPMPHIMAAKAVAFTEANSPQFKAYAHQVVKNAQALAQELIRLGADVITGGTDNHLIIVNVEPFGITGRQAEKALSKGKITVNRNTIPNDPQGPWFTSGIRMGTAAITTLGMKETQMPLIAELIVTMLKHSKPVVNEAHVTSKSAVEVDSLTVEKTHRQIQSLLETFPLYPEIKIP